MDNNDRTDLDDTKKLELSLAYIKELKTKLKEARQALPDQFNIEGDSLANCISDFAVAYRKALEMIPPW